VVPEKCRKTVVVLGVCPIFVFSCVWLHKPMTWVACPSPSSFSVQHDISH